MTDLRNMGIKATGSAAVLAAAMAIAVTDTAKAADWSSTFVSTNRVDYIDNFVNDAQNAAVRDDDIRLSTNNQLYGTGRFASGWIVRVGGRLSYFQHIDRTDQDSLGVGAFADAGRKFGAVFARVGYFGNYRRKDGENQYLENGGRVDLSYRPSRSYQASMAVTGAYRDFDDANFAGLDQSRWSATARVAWYPFEDRTFLEASIGVADSNADVNFNSNIRYFAGVRAAYQVNPKASIGLRARYTAKDFDAGNPAVQGGVTREDDIYEVFGRFDYQYSKNVTAFAEAGVVDQQSNIVTQDFTGPRVGVGVKLLFNTAR